jgi:hypothetical protein
MTVPDPADPGLLPRLDHSCSKWAVADGSLPRAFADGPAVVPLLGGAVRHPNAT